MTYTVYLNVPCRPRPQQRHRHARNGRAYDPSSEHKRDFLRVCRTVSAPPPDEYITAPVHFRLVCTFARPRSHRTSAGVLRRGSPLLHVYKPDTDNLAKFVMDALNGVYYNDDSQVCALEVRKRYGDEDSIRVQLTYLQS